MKKLKLLLPNRPTTSEELINVCKYYNIPLNGVYAKDKMDTIRHGNYIVNLQNHNQGGSHWTALICDATQCCWFDSFGSVPPQDIHESLIAIYPRIYFSNFIIQNRASQNCGLFVVGLFLYLEKHKKQKGTLVNKVDKYVDLFVDNTIYNDDILGKFLYKNT